MATAEGEFGETGQQAEGCPPESQPVFPSRGPSIPGHMVSGFRKHRKAYVRVASLGLKAPSDLQNLVLFFDRDPG